MLILSLLKQFQILSLVTIKIFGVDFSITNALSVILLALLCFSGTNKYFFSFNNNCFNTPSFSSRLFAPIHFVTPYLTTPYIIFQCLCLNEA